MENTNNNPAAKRDKKVVAAVTAIGDSVRFSKNGEYTVKRGFFYRHGNTCERMAQAIKAAVPNARITLCEEHYNSWPRDSWFEVRFMLEAG